MLGSAEAWVGRRPVDLGSPKQRTVASILLLEAGRPVPMETLIGRVWGQTPPPQARESVYAYVARLRGLLEPGRGRRPRIVKDAAGYRIDVDPDTVDLHRFQRYVAASHAESSAARRHRHLGSALALWRGTALSGLEGAWCDRVRAWLDEEHVAALALFAETKIALGRGEEAVRMLRRAIAARPASETLVAQLIRAQTAGGHQADALRTYAAARTLISRELGSEPGAELRDLYENLLRGTARNPMRVVPGRAG
ncbi:AfsR/SARP family transcriptional regulator [Kineosporia babensis]|uniref:AfsR/SARP family transcriptional regulator n=1 Tax=Kineosporia babensis TaxID=499548 RepID=UPI002F34F35F